MAEWQSDGLVMERSRFQVPTGAAGEFISPGSTFCADIFRCPSHPHVTTVPVILPKVNVAGYSRTHMHHTYVVSKLVHGCMVFKERAPRRQQFDAAPSV